MSAFIYTLGLLVVANAGAFLLVALIYYSSEAIMRLLGYEKILTDWREGQFTGYKWSRRKD